MQGASPVESDAGHKPLSVVGHPLLALCLWTSGSDFINATTVAIGVVALMVIARW
jgi:hypothetical protein